ncbi:hypothetical protein AMIS_20300 [Actinoplanes missouriensis 431]|uniref:Uncharacterized protein n=1 Tax=Actinoplanes missouriensis (strain ATCC 14538 / DSM 43046 / CBS 188.64 / JCM 3121 / NBRC 102363 / NCIMB 12654 / NRRL B-3342 / UNCC 431) TaxID=512565 RepID=I0H2L3_ACTM4|nr:hypothetical protein [Actinoplanes missouriensis]BAL87250.1 hypothetical protein AMIS_20300 [Actinoplanes missouriensis 431]
MTTNAKRFTTAVDSLRQAGIAVNVDRSGSSIVGEDDLNSHLKHAAGNPRWVGACPGSDELGGVVSDDEHVFLHRETRRPVDVVYFAFNHRHPDLADLLVDAFTTNGLHATWDRRYGSVILHLDEAIR